MSELDDMALVAQYAGKNSEEAFAELVRRHVNLVYSVALRYAGQGADAQDITQTVFITLARKAAKLREKTVLTGWLYETTRFTAMSFMRNNFRRQLREQEAEANPDDSSGAWRQLAPLLEEGMTRLNEKERTLLALRFFENKTGAEAAAALGIQEWAARKRADRAVEKLRTFFARRGVSLSAATLVAAISANSVQAAPAVLASSAITAALAEGTIATGSTLMAIKGALNIMTWTKTGIISAAVAAAVLVPLGIQYQAQARLRGEDEAISRQAEQLARTRAENERLSALASDRSLSAGQLNELQKLQAEAESLRQQTNEIARLEEERRQLKVKQAQPKSPLQAKEEAMAKLSYGKNWAVAFFQYAGQHQGQFPTNFDQASSLVAGAVTEQTEVTPDQFDIVFQGAPSKLSSAQDIILFREKQAWPVKPSENEPVKWGKAYTFVDGHCEIRMQPDNNFDAYEQQHILQPTAGNP